MPTAAAASDTEDRREPSALDTLSLFERLKAWVIDGRDKTSDWRKGAREDFAFAALEQYTEAEKELLQSQLRPVVVFDRTGPVLDSVAGLEVSNRQQTTFLPREVGDTGVNELLTGTADWVRDECDAEDEESDAFYDNCICGMGWTETRLDMEVEQDGKIVIERADPLEMYWDPYARKKNIDDARWVARVKDIELDEARAMFPDADDEDMDAAWASDPGDTHTHERERSKHYANRPVSIGDSRATTRQKVRIVEIQWWERAPYWVALDPASQQTIEIPEEALKVVRARAKEIDLPFKVVKLQRRVYRKAFLGAVVLETGTLGEDDSPIPGFTLKCMTGKRDRNKNTWYGLMRPMKDPQRWANKLFSTVQHNISTGGRGIMAETTAVTNVRSFERDWARPDKVKWLKEGAIVKGAIKQIEPAPLPTGVVEMLQLSISAIRDSTGVNLELLGLADRQQAGVLEQQRKQAGMTILATLFDALRRYRKEQGRVLLYFIQHYIPPGTLIRLSGKDGEQYVPFAMDAQTAKFDVIVDEAPSSPNNKDRTWVVLQSLLPLLMKASLPMEVWAEIAQYLPLPQSLTSKIGAALTGKEGQGQGPDPEVVKAQGEQQIEQAKLQADVQAKQAELAMKEKELQARFALEDRKLKLEEMKVLMEQQDRAAQPQGNTAEMALKQFEMQAKIGLEEKKIQLDERRIAAELALKQREMDTNTVLRREDSQRSAAMKQEDAAFKREQSTAKGPSVVVDGTGKAIDGVERLLEGTERLGETMAQFMIAQARDAAEQKQRLAELVAAIAAPKQKQISGTLPSGGAFNATVSET